MIQAVKPSGQPRETDDQVAGDFRTLQGRRSGRSQVCIEILPCVCVVPVKGPLWLAWLRPGAMVAATVACSAGSVLTGSGLGANLHVGLAIVGVAAWLRTIALSLRGATASRAIVWGAASGLLLIAVLLPPRGSQDLWSYVVQGRMLTFHGLSPYTSAPIDIGTVDEFVLRVPHGWQGAHSPYGPLFTAIEAVAARLSGDSVLANRIGYQLLAAVPVVVVAALYDRSGPPRAATFLLLAPVTVTIVNGGHADFLIGALLALGFHAVKKHRVGVAQVSLAAAALIKPTALVVVAGLVGWSLTRARPRGGDRGRDLVAGVGMGALVVAGYLAAGGVAAARPVFQTADQISRVTIWAQLFRVAPVVASPVVVTAGWITLFGCLSVAVYRRYRAQPSPRPLAIGLGCAALLSLPFVLPWYVGWCAPLAADEPAHESSLITAAIAGALAIGYANPPGTSLPPFAAAVSGATLPIAALLAWTLLGARARAQNADENAERRPAR